MRTVFIGLPQGSFRRGRRPRVFLLWRKGTLLLLWRFRLNPDRLSIGRSIAATALARLRDTVDVLQSTMVGRGYFDVCPGVAGLR